MFLCEKSHFVNYSKEATTFHAYRDILVEVKQFSWDEQTAGRLFKHWPPRLSRQLKRRLVMGSNWRQASISCSRSSAEHLGRQGPLSDRVT